jgi:hypothetical protein
VQVYPGAQIQTLEEVLEFIRCYGDGHININLEASSISHWPFEYALSNHTIDKS